MWTYKVSEDQLIIEMIASSLNRERPTRVTRPVLAVGSVALMYGPPTVFILTFFHDANCSCMARYTADTAIFSFEILAVARLHRDWG